MVGLQPKADALDIVTQFVSLLSIILAQYVYIERYSYAAASGGNNGKAVATVLFVGSNAVLLLVHLFLIGGPLWDKTKTAFLEASILWGNKQQDATPGTFSSKQRLDMILTRHPCHSDFLLVNILAALSLTLLLCLSLCHSHSVHMGNHALGCHLFCCLSNNAPSD